MLQSCKSSACFLICFYKQRQRFCDELMLDRASTYIGSVVVFLAILHSRTVNWIFPLAITVSTYGCLETLMIGNMPWSRRVANLLGHVCIPLACFVREEPIISSQAVVLAMLVLFCVFCTYLLADYWPYTISQPLSLLFVLLILVILFTNSRKM